MNTEMPASAFLFLMRSSKIFASPALSIREVPATVKSTPPTWLTPNPKPVAISAKTDAAEKAAKRVYGVRAVANDLEVKLSSSRTDPEIARDIVQELASHISIPATNLKATVRSGWVTLEGKVDWQYQKALAESAVKTCQGVPSTSCRRIR